MSNQTKEEEVTEEFLTLVYVDRQFSRDEFGDDYENGKSPWLLLTALVSAVGEVADAVIGNTARDDRIADCVSARDALVVVGGAAASLYELMGRFKEEFEAEDSDGSA
jgi:NTP pyrophosphatase (non-canonical NTP hydrolase)